MIDVSRLTVDVLTERLRARGLNAAVLQENQRFYDGDHWQDGAGWVGQRPELGTPDYASIMSQIQTGFVSENIIKEVVDRHVGGVLGREPAWDYVLRRPLAEVRDEAGKVQRDENGQVQREQPTAEEQVLLTEADAVMTSWWDQRKPFRLLQQAVAAALQSGRSVLRVYIPRGLRDRDGRITRPQLVDALTTIRVHLPDVTAAGVLTDPATEADYGVYIFTQDQLSYAEVSYLDDAGRTIIRIIKPDGGFVESEPLELGGHLTIFELKRDVLITAQVRQLQKALNLANTKMLRNVNVAGDLERTLLNAEPPTKEIDDPANPGKKIRVPAPYRTGAGATAFVQGAATRDAAGNITSRENPSISYRDPVDVTTFVETRDTYYAAILGQCQQTHALISGDATASGKSREQARAEYEASLDMTKGPTDEALRWLLETVLTFASQIAGQPRRFAGLRAEGNCHADSGPLSAEERRANREDFAQNLLSRETVMSRNGVDDTDAENERIRSEGDKLDEEVKVWEVVGSAVQAGVPLAFYLAEELGWKPDKIAKLELAMEETATAATDRFARTLDRGVGA